MLEAGTPPRAMNWKLCGDEDQLIFLEKCLISIPIPVEGPDEGKYCVVHPNKNRQKPPFYQECWHASKCAFHALNMYLGFHAHDYDTPLIDPDTGDLSNGASINEILAYAMEQEPNPVQTLKQSAGTLIEARSIHSKEQYLASKRTHAWVYRKDPETGEWSNSIAEDPILTLMRILQYLHNISCAFKEL